jgi:cytochrome c biogenesis protein CcdA
MGIFLFLLLMGFLDCLNPTTIITQILIVIKSKSVKISSLFIFGTFFTYFISGLLLYYGIAVYLIKFTSAITIKRNLVFIICEIVLLTISIFYCIKKNAKTEKPKSAKNIFLSNYAILSIAIGSTLSDMPTALPYFAFIGKLKQTSISLLAEISCLFLYNLIYVLPLIIIVILYRRNNNYFEVYFNKIEYWIDKLGKLLFRIIILSIILILLLDIVFYFTDYKSIWNFMGFNFIQ